MKSLISVFVFFKADDFVPRFSTFSQNPKVLFVICISEEATIVALNLNSVHILDARILHLVKTLII